MREVGGSKVDVIILAIWRTSGKPLPTKHSQSLLRLFKAGKSALTNRGAVVDRAATLSELHHCVGVDRISRAKQALQMDAIVETSPYAAYHPRTHPGGPTNSEDGDPPTMTIKEYSEPDQNVAAK